jgi:AcrR family transcriptional regulator
VSNAGVLHAAGRELNTRQAETVARLVAAALTEVRAVGFEVLTVRSVAARASVAPATAYTYFASKNHLVAEAFWRELQRLPRAEQAAGATAAGRVRAVFRQLADFLGDEPALASAVTVALLGGEPDVKRLRLTIGAEINERLRDALGEDTSALELLALAWSGAMLQAGMGHTTYAQMGDQLVRVTDLVLEEQR